MEKKIFAQLAAGPFPRTVTDGATINCVKKFIARGWLDGAVDSASKGRYTHGQHAVALVRGVTEAGLAVLKA